MVDFVKAFAYYQTRFNRRTVERHACKLVHALMVRHYVTLGDDA
jgi:hypothetical protein